MGLSLLALRLTAGDRSWFPLCIAHIKLGNSAITAVETQTFTHAKTSSRSLGNPIGVAALIASANLHVRDTADWDDHPADMTSLDIESNYFRVNLFNGVSLAYVDCAGDSPLVGRRGGTIVLLHGFPQTSYQFRKVIPLLSSAGYRVLAPDYRGAGESSKPSNGFSKSIMAADIVALLDHLEIDEPVHVVGHDVGGQIAFVLASRWPERVASACFGECFLPGTKVYEDQLKNDPVNYFHFAFHCVSNLPEALIQGREKLYIDFFINKLCYRIGAFSPAQIERYTHAYSQPGSLRCAFELFRALEKDADDTREWMSQNGKCKVPCMVFSGEYSSYGERAESMALEVVQKSHLTTAIVRESGHFVAEENASGFSQVLLEFVWRQSGEQLPTH